VCVEYETNQKVVSVNTRDAYVPLCIQGGSQKLLLTTKESNVNLMSPVVFFLDHPVFLCFALIIML